MYQAFEETEFVSIYWKIASKIKWIESTIVLTIRSGLRLKLKK